MPYHLYVKPSGFADISEYPLNGDIFPDYVYLGEFPTKPDVEGKRYVGEVWVRGSREPEYLENRRKAYPKTNQLIQALWQAMDQGILPKVPGFYDKIDEVNKRFPET